MLGSRQNFLGLKSNWPGSARAGVRLGGDNKIVRSQALGIALGIGAFCLALGWGRGTGMGALRD